MVLSYIKIYLDIHKLLFKFSETTKRSVPRKCIYLEEVLDALRCVAVALAANALDLLDLPGLAGCLDVLEVNLGVLQGNKIGEIQIFRNIQKYFNIY